jgi:hypothetical protein
MSDVEQINQTKNTYHASQKRVILNWQSKNMEKIKEYSRKRHKIRMETDEIYNARHKERTHAYYLKCKAKKLENAKY